MTGIADLHTHTLHSDGLHTPEEVVADLPELEIEDIRECLRYAAWLASGRTLDTPTAA